MRPATISCGTCGVDVLVAPIGRVPRFCSDKCRKVSYGGRCVDCGKRTDGSYGRAKAAARCLACHKVYAHERARGRIIAAIRDWVDEHGTPPTAFHWNPEEAIRHGHPEWAVYYRATRHRWASSSDAQRIFGSWSAAIEAAGFLPLPQGVRRDPEAWHAAILERARPRREEIRRLWDEGRTGPEIADLLGMTRGGVWKAVQAMRRDGWNISYHQPPRKVAA